MNTLFLSQEKPKTIYTNNPELVVGESLSLSETKQNYLLNLTQTQSLTIDESQLSDKANQYGIVFNLTVICTDHYVINFQDCNVNQIEFYRGKSELKFTKNWGSGKWDIDIVKYGGIAPTLSLYDYNLRCEFCEKQADSSSYTTPITMWCNSYDETNNNNWSKQFTGSEIDYYTFSLNPFILTEFSVHYGTYTASYPSQIQVYGSNDFYNWDQLFSNTSISIESNTTPHFTPTIIRPYKHYKFHLSNGNNGNMEMPPISMKGIGSELLYAGYINKFPSIVGAINGYEVTIDTANETLSDDTTAYGAVTGDGISLSRTSTVGINWSINYTYPEAVRPCGFYIEKWDGTWADNKQYYPSWYGWYGSNDGETWDLAVQIRDTTSNVYTTGYYPCDFGISRKYWQFRVWSTGFADVTKIKAKAITPLLPTYQYSNFESIVPVMSSDSQDGYTVSASSTTDGAAYKMYDGDSTTYCGGSISDGSWSTTIDMGAGVIIQGIQMRTTSDWNRMPTVFKIQGSNDNSDWTDISTQTPGSNFWENNTDLSGSFEFYNATSYRYYRLLVTATAQGSYVRICDLGWTTQVRRNPIDSHANEYLIPIMSSASQDGYIVSASSVLQSGREPYRVFDRNSTTWWTTLNKTDGSSRCDEWIQIQLPVAKVVDVLSLTAIPGKYYAREVAGFVLQGSSDGSNWTDLLTETNTGYYRYKTFYFNNTTAYLYYKLRITRTNASVAYVQIAQIDLCKNPFN